jgi:hypothetical protein
LSPATTWTKLTGSGDNWQEGIPAISVPVRILFGAIVFDQGRFLGEVATSFTESSVGATSFTESSVAATTWTEMT